MERYPLLVLGWQNHPVHTIICPIQIHRVNAIPIKIPTAFFRETEKIILKLYRSEETQNTKSHAGQHKQGRRPQDPGYQAMLESYPDKTMNWHDNRRTGQWNRRKGAEACPAHLATWHSTKGPKIHAGGKTVL